MVAGEEGRHAGLGAGPASPCGSFPGAIGRCEYIGASQPSAVSVIWWLVYVWGAGTGPQRNLICVSAAPSPSSRGRILV